MHKRNNIPQAAGMSAKMLQQGPISERASPRNRNPQSFESSDARARRSSAALRGAMLKLLECKACDQITIREICKEARVHYATFFRHFKTKEGLLDFIARDQIATLNELTLSIRGSDDYAAGFRAACSFVEDHRELWSILLNGGAGAAMREEWVRQSMQVAMTEEPVNSWLPTDLGTICAATLIAETLAWWVNQPADSVSIDQISSILLRLLTGSVMAPD